MKKFEYIIAMLTLLFSTVAVITVFVWWLYPYNPLVIEQPLKIMNENKTVEVGEPLIYKTVFTKNTDKFPIIHRQLINGVVYTLPSITPMNKAGDHKQVITNLTIPNLPTGEYYLTTSACYEMNPIRTVCVDYDSEIFIINSNR